jgi:hypothetical protein
MARKKSQFLSEPACEIRLSAELTKRIEHWSRANGDDARAEAMGSSPAASGQKSGRAGAKPSRSHLFTGTNRYPTNPTVHDH